MIEHLDMAKVVLEQIAAKGVPGYNYLIFNAFLFWGACKETHLRQFLAKMCRLGIID